MDKTIGKSVSKTPEKSQTPSAPPTGSPQPSTSSGVANTTFKKFTLRTVPMEFSEGTSYNLYINWHNIILNMVKINKIPEYIWKTHMAYIKLTQPTFYPKLSLKYVHNLWKVTQPVYKSYMAYNKTDMAYA